MRQYLELLKNVLEQGEFKEDRTGTGTYSVFGRQLRFNLQEGLPLVTTKKLHMRSIIYELLWFLKGSTNIAFLQENGVSIWNEWADAEGNLGPVYGKQWRNWESKTGQIIDQIAEVIHAIKNNPMSRRLIVSAWNVGELDQMALAPCHALFQFYVSGNKLSCQLYQRSCDVFLGLPFNIASYALLTYMIARDCGLVAHEFIWTGGDVHLYQNHIEQAKLQLSRTPLPLPQLKFSRPVSSVFNYEFTDFIIENYQSHPAIKAPIAV